MVQETFDSGGGGGSSSSGDDGGGDGDTSLSVGPGDIDTGSQSGPEGAIDIGDVDVGDLDVDAGPAGTETRSGSGGSTSGSESAGGSQISGGSGSGDEVESSRIAKDPIESTGGVRIDAGRGAGSGGQQASTQEQAAADSRPAQATTAQILAAADENIEAVGDEQVRVKAEGGTSTYTGTPEQLASMGVLADPERVEQDILESQAEEFSEGTAADVRSEDVVLRHSEGGIEAALADDAQQEVAARNIALQFGIQEGADRGGRFGENVHVRDVDPQAGEDFTIEGDEVDISERFLREQIAAQDPRIYPGDVLIDQDGVTETQAGAAQQAGGLFDSFVPGALGGAAAGAVVQSGEVTGTRLTSGAQRRLVETEVAASEDLEPGEEFTVTVEDGEPQVELTEAGEETLRQREREANLEGAPALERYGQFILGPPGDVEQDLGAAGSQAFEDIAGPPGGIERTVGGLVPAELHEGTDLLGEGVSAGVQAVEGQEAVQRVIGPGGFEETILEGSQKAADFVSDQLGPASDVAGDVAEVGFRWSPQGQLVGLATGQGPVDQAIGLGTAAGDVLRPEDQERGPRTLPEIAEEEAFGAVASVAPFAVRSPQYVQSVGETAFESSISTLSQNPAESVIAAGAFSEQAAREVATQTAREPVMTAGMLLGTGGVFAAARAVGPRASLATRAALQPGEELVGRGGAAAFNRGGSAISRAGAAAPGISGAALDRLSGGTQRAGDVLFPRGEPLFASEEAAMMVAQRARQGAGEAAGRVRQAELPDLERPSLPQSPIRRRRVLTPEGLQTEFEIDTPSIPGAGRVRSGFRSARERIELARRRRQRPEPYDPGFEVEIGEGQDVQGVIFLDQPGLTESVNLGPFETETESEQETGESDAGTIGSNVLTGEVETRAESGVAIQRVIGEVEVETDQERVAESDTEPIRAEVAVEEQALSPELARPSQVFGFETVAESISGIESRLGVNQEVDTEVGQEMYFEQESETEVEVEPALKIEQEQEQERERESELEREREQESRREAELFDFGDPAEENQLFGFGSVAEEVITDFYDPLTGDVVETERDPRSPGRSMAEILGL